MPRVDRTCARSGLNSSTPYFEWAGFTGGFSSLHIESAASAGVVLAQRRTSCTAHGHSIKNKLLLGSSVSEPAASRLAMLPSAGL